MIQGSSGGVDTRKGYKRKQSKATKVTWLTEKKTETVKPGSIPEASDNNNDSEKVEEIKIEGEGEEESSSNPILLEDTVQK